MITLATPEMIAGLKEIFKKSFADPQWYIDFYFDRRFRPEETFVYVEDGRPVSMLAVFPAQLMQDGKYKTVLYVYGVATLPEYQGRGFSRTLLGHVNEHMPYGAEATFLCPATESLFGFYKKQGYEPAFGVKELALAYKDIPGNIKTSIIMQKINAADYKAIRDAAFESEGYLNWSLENLEYMLAENELLNGSAVSVEANGQKDILFYRIWDKQLVVKETTLDGDLLTTALKRLMEEKNVSGCHVRLHPESRLGDGVKAFAMIYGKSPAKMGYFNLALD